MKDPAFLAQKSSDSTLMDLAIANDLKDTLRYHKEHCVGMAANMIGVHKKIIAINYFPFEMVMLNPRITKKMKPYKTEEGCLSLTGVRKTTRYQKIEVEYQDLSFNKKTFACEGFVAQIIQHEIDHCNGIVI